MLLPALKEQSFRPLDNVFETMLGLSDDELRPVLKEDVEEIVREMENLFRDYVPHDEVPKRCEKFCLDFALKCFQSSNLQKRMNGLSYIEECIDMVRNRRHQAAWEDGMYHVSSHPSYMTRLSVAKWMDAKILLSWLRDHRILESLFVPGKFDLHGELIRRSKNILQFIAQEKYLTDSDLDMMWSATEQHATIAEAVYELLGGSCNHMPLQQQKHLISKMQSISFSRFTPQIINLIATSCQSYGTMNFTETKV